MAQALPAGLVNNRVSASSDGADRCRTDHQGEVCYLLRANLYEFTQGQRLKRF